MKVDVIVGGLYGDEGKGKIVSNLGNNYDYVFRVNASTNASHTVSLEDSVFVTKQLPSVFFNQKIKYVIAPGAILNLNALKEELFQRPDNLKDRVFIASSITLLIEPYIDMTKKSDVSKNLGSTNQGTGIAIVARSRRHCIKLVDIANVIKNRISKEELIKKVEFSCNELDKDFFGRLNINKELYLENLVEDLIRCYKEIESKIGIFSVDYTLFLSSLTKKSSILIEGCNGIMLDNLHGLHPYTTSASTSINSLLNGANLSPYLIDKSYIVCTGYFCCLNKRPFLTEMNEKESSLIYKHNEEIDDAEGMKRRLGWFDLATLKKALVGHYNCELIINKLDIMQDLEFVKVCVGYQDKNNKYFEYMPDDVLDLQEMIPVYETFKGWGKLDNNPFENKNLMIFLKFIEEETNFKISHIGVGRKDSDLIECSHR